MEGEFLSHLHPTLATVCRYSGKTTANIGYWYRKDVGTKRPPVSVRH